MAGRTYSARVMKFRAGVYANRDKITAGAQVLLLRLSDDMSANAIVSIPRSQLADEFDCDPARITEWIKQAKAAGFLDTVRRARPKVTAVYQGLYVAPEVRPSAPLAEVRKTAPIGVRHSAPLSDVQRCALTPTQEGVRPEGIGQAVTSPTPQRSSYGEVGA